MTDAVSAESGLPECRVLEAFGGWGAAVHKVLAASERKDIAGRTAAAPPVQRDLVARKAQQPGNLSAGETTVLVLEKEPNKYIKKIIK